MAPNGRTDSPPSLKRAGAQVPRICQAAKVMEFDGLARSPAGAGVNALPQLADILLDQHVCAL
ncbi:hypothetical protein EP51_45655 (plasmid) [Rhodococcus opacus]|uniref:Uncharacterized protein n=1 Tax=Rhodococcus opacus TaxID=37919 RepID=A0A076EZD1_RHOOP|nr:hypothetical protein EP51_45655 [Rhodococcus opacus]